MKVSLTDAGKRFNRDWIFRNLNQDLNDGVSYAITGPNGSGKSTLLQVIAGSMQLSQGQISWKHHELSIPSTAIYHQVSICAPYLELVEEMTFEEFINYHSRFKPLQASLETIAERTGLQKAIHKQIRHFSSGMKQRAKLAQSIFSDTAILLLDEPCTNLDANGIAIYHQLIEEYGKNRLIVVSSNDETEYSFCEERIEIMKFKE